MNGLRYRVMLIEPVCASNRLGEPVRTFSCAPQMAFAEQPCTMLKKHLPLQPISLIGLQGRFEWNQTGA